VVLTNVVRHPDTGGCLYDYQVLKNRVRSCNQALYVKNNLKGSAPFKVLTPLRVRPADPFKAYFKAYFKPSALINTGSPINILKNRVRSCNQALYVKNNLKGSAPFKVLTPLR